MSTTFGTQHQAAPDEEKLELVFTIRPQNAEDEQLLFRSLEERQPLLWAEIMGLVPAVLGPMFQLEKIDVRRGSVEFLVYIAGTFTLISQYNDFVTSLARLEDQIKGILYRSLGRFSGVSITTSQRKLIEPKPQRPARSRFFHEPKDLIMLLMTSYLIVSHGVMLVVLLRIAVKVFLQTNPQP